MLRALPGGKARRPSLSACPCTGCNFRWSTCGHNKTFACPLTRANLTHRHAAAPGFHSTASGLKCVWRAACDNWGARARVAFAVKLIENLKMEPQVRTGNPGSPAECSCPAPPAHSGANTSAGKLRKRRDRLQVCCAIMRKETKKCLSRGGSSVVVSAQQSHTLLHCSVACQKDTATSTEQMGQQNTC